jgi:hypothetical protein
MRPSQDEGNLYGVTLKLLSLRAKWAIVRPDKNDPSTKPQATVKWPGGRLEERDQSIG